MKKGSDNFRKSAIFDVISNIKDKTNVIIYEPTIKESDFYGLKIVNDLEEFKKSDLIVANRIDEKIVDVKNKIYTRDIYNKD